MKKYLIMSFLAIFLLFPCGCATEKIAESLAGKNVSGNGTMIDTHVGINTDTKIPELRTLFVSGDFSTTRAGANAITYREESSVSAWNASAVTRKRMLSVSLADSADVPATVSAFAAILDKLDVKATGSSGTDQTTTP